MKETQKSWFLWVCNPKKLGFYGYVLGMKPKKVGFYGFGWVPYPKPTQKPNHFWVPMSELEPRRCRICDKIK